MDTTRLLPAPRRSWRLPRRQLPAVFIVLALLTAVAAGCAPSAPGTTAQAGTPGHVFVINLENKGYDEVWGSKSRAPYLSTTLREQGVLLSNYYGIAHNSLPNYLAQISGQPPNSSTEKDCPTYTRFRSSGTDSQGRLLGTGCVYPGNVQTIASQLTDAGKTWKAYMEDMSTPCQHPTLDSADENATATARNQYATRHDPFVYFQSVTSTPACQTNVVNLSALQQDLKSAGTTPNLSYISPNLCHDGHDNPCADGTPGGLPAADTWLRENIPSILASPAFQQDGMLVITFDETDGGTVGPSTGVTGGTAGGQVGALVISPFTPSGATSDHPYNHYSLLASIEGFFSLPRLAGAGEPGVDAFGKDVYRSGT